MGIYDFLYAALAFIGFGMVVGASLSVIKDWWI